MSRYGLLFRALRALYRCRRRKSAIEHAENIHTPAVYVVHHQNAAGPLQVMTSWPETLHLWVLHVFFDEKAARTHYRDFTYSKRIGGKRWWSAPAAAVVAFIASRLVRSARAVPVYRGHAKLRETFIESSDWLAAGESILVAPDISYADANPDMKEIYTGFLLLEHTYFKRTGRRLPFIPVYCSQKKRKIFLGEAVFFDSDLPDNEERERVARLICAAVNDMGVAAGEIIP